MQPVIKLDKGLHALHLFYRVDRARWAALPPGESEQCRLRLEKLCAANANPSHPRLSAYANVGGKADLAFFLLAAGLAEAGQMHRDLEAAFPPGALNPVFSYLSVTELTEYMPAEEDHRRRLLEEEKLAPKARPSKSGWANCASGCVNTKNTAFTRNCPIGRSWPSIP